jgi:hypothetical protein
MADYPKEIIGKLDATCTSEGWTLLFRLYLPAMIASLVALYLVGTIVQGIL